MESTTTRKQNPFLVVALVVLCIAALANAFALSTLWRFVDEYVRVPQSEQTRIYGAYVNELDAVRKRLIESAAAIELHNRHVDTLKNVDRQCVLEHCPRILKVPEQVRYAYQEMLEVNPRERWPQEVRDWMGLLHTQLAMLQAVCPIDSAAHDPRLCDRLVSTLRTSEVAANHLDHVAIFEMVYNMPYEDK